MAMITLHFRTAYNLIKACIPGSDHDPRWVSQTDAQWWKEHFETCGYSLRPIADPGSDYLSQADIRMLDTAYSKFRHAGRFQVANDISHIYPEWVRVYDRNAPVNVFPINPMDFFNERAALSASIGIALQDA